MGRAGWPRGALGAGGVSSSPCIPIYPETTFGSLWRGVGAARGAARSSSGGRDLSVVGDGARLLKAPRCSRRCSSRARRAEPVAGIAGIAACKEAHQGRSARVGRAGCGVAGIAACRSSTKDAARPLALPAGSERRFHGRAELGHAHAESAGESAHGRPRWRCLPALDPRVRVERDPGRLGRRFLREPTRFAESPQYGGQGLIDRLVRRRHPGILARVASLGLQQQCRYFVITSLQVYAGRTQILCTRSASQTPLFAGFVSPATSTDRVDRKDPKSTKALAYRQPATP